MAQPLHMENTNFSTAFAKVLDKRLLKALGEMGFARPTQIQAQAIPIALDGRDILARARTGSGKTAAYCIPVVQKILQAKAADSSSVPCTRALILVPTKELSEQVTAYLRKLLIYCDKTVRATNIASGASGQIQRMLLADVPDVIVATPARVIALLQSKVISLSSLESLVIDEADLILSYGHDADVRNLLSGDYLPKLYQSLLMSATMTEDVETLKGIALRDPAILILPENDDPSSSSSTSQTLSQYFLRTSPTDKFLLIYVILKLRLVQGKCILFVADVDRSYRLKLFLEQFGIKSCVLNPELPINSRFHIVQEFNKGVYDYIIASDESAVVPAEQVDEDENDKEEETTEPVVPEMGEGTNTKVASKKRKQSPVAAASTSKPSKRVKILDAASATENGDHDHDGSSGEDEEDDDEELDSSPKTAKTSSNDSKKSQPSSTPQNKSTNSQSKSKSKSKGNKGKNKEDKEFGVSRGIDFVDVACVINFDFPISPSSYIHRIGRTARAGKSGLSISFVVPLSESQSYKDKGGVSYESCRDDEKVFERVQKGLRERGGGGGGQGGGDGGMKEYEFDKRQVEAFRYRMEDALRSVTRVAVKEARVKELKSEILNSDRLKAHFEDHPLDLEYLRHDKPLRPTRIQPHLKQVPKYLVPRIAPVPSADGTVSVPPTGNVDNSDAKTVGFVPFRKQQGKAGRGGKSGRGGGGGRGGGKSGGGGRKKDPLRKFK